MVQQGLADPELTGLLESVDSVAATITAVREGHGRVAGDPTDLALELETGDASAQEGLEEKGI